MALWRLPRPDFHRLVDTDLQDTPLSLWPARSRSRLATLSIESSDSFVASAVVSIATGWNEPAPGRDLHPLKSSAFHGALLRHLTDFGLGLSDYPAASLRRTVILARMLRGARRGATAFTRAFASLMGHLSE